MITSPNNMIINEPPATAVSTEITAIVTSRIANIVSKIILYTPPFL